MGDFWAIFITISGFAIGLGAVTVIDIHGFLGRSSSYWTEATTRTHKVTKPLIWIGVTLVSIGFLLLPIESALRQLALGTVAVLVLNGLFLTFGVSRFLLRREALGQQKQLLPEQWQRRIAASFVLSFVGWWGLVIFFAWILAS